MKFIRKIFLIFLAFIAILTGISALSNIGLPEESSVKKHLSAFQKAYMLEMLHLRKELGDKVIPGWSGSHTPLIVYNEAYAFLTGYSGMPPAGWVKMPQERKAGHTWESVPDDNFNGATYYRTPLDDASGTPQNFTVKVGGQWIPSLYTREYARIAFFKGLKNDLPGLLKPLVPYRLLWYAIMGKKETYIEALAHESFHAYQGQKAPGKLAKAEAAIAGAEDYPWHNNKSRELWQQETQMLYKAVKAENEAKARRYATDFLEQRKSRRKNAGLKQKHVAYEQKREWLEGLAKYAELRIGRKACESNTYQPVAPMEPISGFHAYEKEQDFWQQQLKEVQRISNKHGDALFYYTGLAQAALLDQICPGWKQKLWEPGISPETLIKQALKMHKNSTGLSMNDHL